MQNKKNHLHKMDNIAGICANVFALRVTTYHDLGVI